MASLMMEQFALQVFQNQAGYGMATGKKSCPLQTYLL
jgi:hypothetical protein